MMLVLHEVTDCQLKVLELLCSLITVDYLKCVTIISSNILSTSFRTP